MSAALAFVFGVSTASSIGALIAWWLVSKRVEMLRLGVDMARNDVGTLNRLVSGLDDRLSKHQASVASRLGQLSHGGAQ